MQGRSPRPNNVQHFLCARCLPRLKSTAIRDCKDDLTALKHPLPLADSEISIGDRQIRNPDEGAYRYKSHVAEIHDGNQSISLKTP